MIMMTIIKTIGSNYIRIYKMPAWPTYFADIITNPPNNFAMKALTGLFSLKKT